MVGKINKSDTTPEMEAADAAARERLSKKKCEHFAVGTYLLTNNRRGYIVARDEGQLLVHFDDGERAVVSPRALNPNGIGHE